jgi:hypothetical protein
MRNALRSVCWVLVLACAQAGATDTPPSVPPPPLAPPPPPPPLPPPPTGPALRLLFVGNSLTYTFDVPTQIQQMAMAVGLTPPTITELAFPNFSLEDNWAQGTGQQDLATGHYDVLIMQQGASTLPESGVDLTHWTGVWAAEAGKTSTRAGFYVVWAPVGGDFDGGIANYLAAADAANTAIYPVAQAWREVMRSDPSIPLYAKDGLHASEHGAWLAALVISSVIFDHPSRPFPNLFPQVITGEQETTLRAAAATAVVQFARR